MNMLSIFIMVFWQFRKVLHNEIRMEILLSSLQLMVCVAVMYSQPEKLDHCDLTPQLNS